MATSVSQLTKFPIAGSLVTSGFLFPEEKILVTGHENGVVVLWELESGKYRVLYTCSSKIQTINCSSKKELLIGSHGGHIVLLKLDGSYTVVRPPDYSVNSRVWKSVWLDDNAFVISSTYGELALFERDGKGSFSQRRLHGHSNSVFGMDRSKSGLLATGDYYGNILVWSKKDSEYEIIQKINVIGSVEDIAWFGDEAFAVINRSGRIHLFEQAKVDGCSWTLISEIGNATGVGKCVGISDDGKTVFGGTLTETVQFDTETQQAGSINIPSVIRVFSVGDDVYVLTHFGLSCFKRRPVEVSPSLIKYKYVKIGLVGHTGVGKSTLCSFITSGSPGDVKSTLGKKIWSWELPKADDLRRLIVLQDHGGQETVISTFLPFLLDSDIILILFQQNDVTTFNKAAAIFDSLNEKIGKNAKIFFVQTHIDQKIDELDEDLIQYLIKEKRIIENLKICPKDGQGVRELKETLLTHIHWDNARTMVQSGYSNGVLQTILRLQENNTSAVPIAGFAGLYRVINKSRIPVSHLKFLLNDYSNQGIVEYNPNALDLVILNEPSYNRLRTEIPIFAMKKKGIVTVEELEKEFKGNKFLPVLDAMYLRYRIAIGNVGRRIFPELLTEKPIQVHPSFQELLKEADKETKHFPDRRFDISNLIAALCELELRCVDVSKYDGLFSWSENAVIYYSFERVGDAIDGFLIRCNYRVGGRDRQIGIRLRSEFLNIIERLYGPSINKQTEQNKKKLT